MYKRASVVVVLDQRVLVVRERNSTRYGLPGGRVRHSESITRAAIRELYEETGLRVREAWRCGHEVTGKYVHHHLVQMVARQGRVRLQRKELTGYHWLKVKTLEGSGHVVLDDDRLTGPDPIELTHSAKAALRIVLCGRNRYPWARYD